MAEPNPTGTRPNQIRHPTLYFPDGNIVITAVNLEGNEVLFRIFKSVLSVQSPVFEHMFSTPQAASSSTFDPNEWYEGVPLVRMPDTLADIERILKVLFDPL